MNRISFSELDPVIRECIDSGAEVRLGITGSSMNPLVIDKRDSVVLKKADGLKRLDVPLYVRPNGQYVLHRIIKIRNGMFVLAGDAQTQVETGITEKDCIAVAAGFYRNGRYIGCDCLKYRVYSRIWVLLRPVRKYLLQLYRILNRRREG